MFVFALVVLVVLLMLPAPYGRYCSASWGWLMDCRYAWLIQELPSLVVPCALWSCHATTLPLTNQLLLSVFIVHYVHRYLNRILLHSTEISLAFYMDEHTFVLLYKSMVRPHVEFANSVWCLFKLGNIHEINKIQKRATKLILKTNRIRKD